MERKIASRNMFYDEKGKHVRTKKEILDESGNLYPGCKIIKKGEVYETNFFQPKKEEFKSNVFLQNNHRLMNRWRSHSENMDRIRNYLPGFFRKQSDT